MEWLRTTWSRARAVVRRVAGRGWAWVRSPRRFLLVTVVAALLAFGIPLTVAGVARVGRDVGAWRAEARADWRRAAGQVVAVRDESPTTVRIRYRDDTGTSRLVRVALDARTGRWVGPSVRLRYDAHNHSNVEVDLDGFGSPAVDLLLAGAPLGAGLAGILTAFALWRRRATLLTADRPVVAGSSASVPGAVVLAAGLTAWAVGTVGERGWSGVGAAASHAVDTAFAELLGVLVPVATFVIGCVVGAWLVRHRHRLGDRGVLAEAYGLLDRAAEVVPSPDELLVADDAERAGAPTEANSRINSPSPRS